MGAFSVVGIDGGATKTQWVVLDNQGETVAGGRAGPGNFLLAEPSELEELLRHIARGVACWPIGGVGGFFAGCRTEAERVRLTTLLRTVWPSAQTILVGDDVEASFAAAYQERDGILVLSGTGSHVAGRKENRWERAGGWGHWFGDVGSGYDLARRTLECFYRQYDLSGKLPNGLEVFLGVCSENNPEELARRFFLRTREPKKELAALAPFVFQLAWQGNGTAWRVILKAARELALRAWRIARRLTLDPPVVTLAGGLFEGEPLYEQAFREALLALAPSASVTLCRVPASVGAAWLALRACHSPLIVAMPSLAHPSVEARILSRASTEQPNPRSRNLEGRTTAELVDLFLSQEKAVLRALRAAREKLVQAADLIAAKLLAGGRLFYVGAGTSGRLGVLDASEIPPTFGLSRLTVQAILAGGSQAFGKSQEGAEDHGWEGSLAIRNRKVKGTDVVCGISASGRTPFVLEALRQAKRQGASVILVSCNPNRPACPSADVCVDLPTGAEILAGSTRLKAGTATKVALNMFSTIAMIRLGRVRDNLMVGMLPQSEKLRQRAIRLVTRLARIDAARASEVLQQTGWDIPAALNRLERIQRKTPEQPA
ncbi:N-acetylmuramic acid 6-phosphate etherase [Candidatus Methylacidithermus pantelleriae]|uniref:N-acetylglucosamine kinase fused to sugar phosphate isomerase n=1 Tax=Candidatus Methylacidithermus pantelleriae TaxID=2744239 RepID=A0A8J2FMW3_9BACT|nr:N-acetylmuramic acid 6-phosphate etherase [Candidatus Methylacidithermus pantelleriae]CAF0689957.1 N-acetylglucosamine kinase fused to sugar phosphate isomerase [Candidatus Methylacidithermus pantelleriae]